MLADIYHFCYTFSSFVANTFIACTLFFNSFGMAYECAQWTAQPAVGSYSSAAPKNSAGIGARISEIAAAAAAHLSTWLIITDPAMMQSIQALTVECDYEDKYTKAFDEYIATFASASASASASTAIYNQPCSVSNNSILLEHTPIGNVVMKYDIESGQFVYYADRSLTTRQLQSVGRKFIMQFACAALILKAATEQENAAVQEDKDKDKDKAPARGGLAAKSGVMTSFKRQVVTPKPPKGTDAGNVDYSAIDYLAAAKFVKRGRLRDFSFIQPAGRVRVARRHYTAKDSSETLHVSDTITNTNATHTQSTHMARDVCAASQHVDKTKLTFAEYKKLMADMAGSVAAMT